ncbi:hypothetical protein CC79DRAFT_1362146 [Sarocladium strictum]
MARTRGMVQKAKRGSKPHAGRARLGKAAPCKSIKLKSTTRAVGSRLSFTPKLQKAGGSGSDTASASICESGGEPPLTRKPSAKPYTVHGNPPPRPKPRRSISVYAPRFEQHSPSPGARPSQVKRLQVTTGLDPDDEASYVKTHPDKLRALNMVTAFGNASRPAAMYLNGCEPCPADCNIFSTLPCEHANKPFKAVEQAFAPVRGPPSS